MWGDKSMLILVIGGSGSGKSEYAENLILQLAKGNKDSRLYYLATMKVYGEEGLKKVERHRKLRAGKGFETLEQTENIEMCIRKSEKDSIVLLECMSNLVANEMFADDGIISESDVVKNITKDIDKLADYYKDMVIVTNNVFDDGVKYDDATMGYIRSLGKINQYLAKKADKVIEVVAGIPVMLKE